MAKKTGFWLLLLFFSTNVFAEKPCERTPFVMQILSDIEGFPSNGVALGWGKAAYIQDQMKFSLEITWFAVKINDNRCAFIFDTGFSVYEIASAKKHGLKISQQQFQVCADSTVYGSNVILKSLPGGPISLADILENRIGEVVVDLSLHGLYTCENFDQSQKPGQFIKNPDR